MYNLLFGLMLTSFISVNGQVMETTPMIASAYEETVVTDIGNPENVASEETLESELSSEETFTSETPGETQTEIVYEDNSQEVMLLSEAVELLAENSASVTGTLNSSVLNLMDRMVDSYPDYYTYAGFRTSSDDNYASVLYISKYADVDGNTITFGEDCKAIHFTRYTESGYSSYLYYDVYDSPNATVDVTTHSIVYTDALESSPALGTKTQIPTEIIWLGFALAGFAIIFTRRH